MTIPQQRTRLKWPFPGDSAVDRSRRIGRSYRAELYAIAPDRCIELDEKARRLGEGWVAPRRLEYDVDDLLTAPEAADVLGVQPGTVRQWGSRGLVKRYQNVNATRYRLGDLIDYQAEQRRRRAATQKAG